MTENDIPEAPEKILDNRELTVRIKDLEKRVEHLETAVLKGYVAQVEKAKTAKAAKERVK